MNGWGSKICGLCSSGLVFIGLWDQLSYVAQNNKKTLILSVFIFQMAFMKIFKQKSHLFSARTHWENDTDLEEAKFSLTFHLVFFWILVSLVFEKLCLLFSLHDSFESLWLQFNLIVPLVCVTNKTKQWFDNDFFEKTILFKNAFNVDLVWFFSSPFPISTIILFYLGEILDMSHVRHTLLGTVGWTRLATEFLGLSAKWKCRALVQKLLRTDIKPSMGPFLAWSSMKPHRSQPRRQPGCEILGCPARSHIFMERVKATLWDLFCISLGQYTLSSLVWLLTSLGEEIGCSEAHILLVRCTQLPTYNEQSHILLLEV